MIVPRVEGTLQLVQEPGGRLRAAGARPRGIERLLLGRSPLEAVYLSQQASAHSGVSHALAAVRAWEDAGKLPVAPNGVLLRELLHLLSFLHGHVQHFYFQTLPDYLPLSAWVPPLDENGPAARIASGIVASAAKIWEPPPFQSRFDEGARRRFAERTVEAVRTLSSLQRMMSVIGGKFPVVMSIAPGGMTMALDEAGDIATIAPCDRVLHSRMARAGSIRVARAAGKNDANTETAIRSDAAPTKVGRSVAESS